MKKAVFLNDTASRYHHGCTRVSDRIRMLLAERGISVVASALGHQNWRHNDRVIAALKSSDLIIINGEGTLHDGAKNGSELLDIIVSKERRGQPIALINAIWQNNPYSWNELLKKCEIISVRDSQSAGELIKAGVAHARLVPDLSLTGSVAPSYLSRDKILIGDSVRLSSRYALAKAAQHQRGTYIPTKYLQSPIWKISPMAALLWRFYNREFFGKIPEFRMAPNEKAYLSELQRAHSHITGRFHGVCLSMLTHTPFVAVASKTMKIQSLVKDAKLNVCRVIDGSELLANPGLEVPPYSDAELKNIESYITEANLATKQLFDDIRGLV